KLAQIKKLDRAADASKLEMGHVFFHKIMQVILDAKPKLSAPLDQYWNKKFESDRFERGKESQIYSESYLLQFLKVSEAEEIALTASHKYALDHLPEKAPEGLYRGDGIVFVGGGKFNWLTLLSVKRLRSTGCTLPVEVLIPTFEEFEVDMCISVFPSLNARCIYMPTVLFKDDQSRYGPKTKLAFKGYQYKSLAILLSSFENLLLLDGDNVVITSPQNILTLEPFKSTGLVLWPDYWRRSTCPKFYSIAGVKVSDLKLNSGYNEVLNGYLDQQGKITLEETLNVSYHERVGTIPDPSTESGQLVISKKSHFKALLLAFYYNSFGPDFYYPLFSQGAPGEGDKETFIAGAVVLNETFYQVGSFVLAIGNFVNGEFTGRGMGQADPIEDYQRTLEFRQIAETYSDPAMTEKLKALPQPKLMFLHANYPKLNPWELKLKGTTVDEKGRYRLYGSLLKEKSGRDIELEIWQDMEELMCGEMNLQLEAFKQVDNQALCKEILEQKEFLLQTSAALK
ncbi:nucleotide-diphospho-sugar transferase, partial [Metschnikowia bicuspidata]